MVIPKLPNTSYEERRRKLGWDWNIVLSWMRCFGGFVSSRRYHPNQKNEIYNLGVVPEPPGLGKIIKTKRKYLTTKTSKNVLGSFGTLFCHEWGVLEVSEALDDTGLSGKMRSTIWEWSQSPRSSRNKGNIGNTSKILQKMQLFFWKRTFRDTIFKFWNCMDAHWVCVGKIRFRNFRASSPKIKTVSQNKCV